MIATAAGPASCSRRAAAIALVCLAGAAVASTQLCAQSHTPQWWKGNLHTHSLWSDGTEFPELIVEWYRNAGYNFLAFTEHDMLQEGERWIDVNARDVGWPPRNASTRAALPLYRQRFGDWVEERRDGERHLVRLRGMSEYRHMFEQPGQFLLVMGEEITDQGGAHVNAFNLSEPIQPRGGPTTAARTTANLAAVAEQRAVTGRTIPAIINHPNYVWSLTAEDIAGMQQARFFELVSGHMLVHMHGDSLRPSTERLWDIVLSLRHARGSAPVYAVAVDDAHDYRTTSDTIARPGRGWVMVRATELTADALLNALEIGDFYASTGVVLRDVKRDTTRIRIEIVPEAGATYRTYFIGTRVSASLHGTPVPGAPRVQRYDDAVGEVLAVVDGPVAEYTLRGDERYVRARVVSSLPQVDATTQRVLGQQAAWVQPVFR